MSNYLTQLTRRQTGQNERLLNRPEQVKNNAGGFVWKVSDFVRLRRFLILGSEGGTYYQEQRELTRENAEIVTRCAEVDIERTIQEIRRASTGASPKNNESLFALALIGSHSNPVLRKAALSQAVLHDVVRTGSHLLQLVSYLTGLRGWSRGLRRAIGDWYLSQDAMRVAYQVSKYRKRYEWSHQDILRQAHPQGMAATYGNDLAGVFDWVTKGDFQHPEEVNPKVVDFLHAVDALDKTRDADEAVELIKAHNLSWDMVPKDLLTNKKVLRALLWEMPMTALLRNVCQLDPARSAQAPDR